MDRLSSMEIFVAVAESGSFSAASRLLGIPLPTVSRKVMELEEHLEAELLRRSTRRLELSSIGAAYLQSCKRILDSIQDAERVASGEYRAPKGNLSITASLVFGRMQVLPVVTEFLNAYPDIDVRLMQTDRMVNLIEDHIDVAFRIGELADSSLMSIRLGATRYVACASPNYIKARGTPVRIASLTDHDCITYEGLLTPSANIWQFRQGKKTVSITVHSRLVVSTIESAIDAAVAGLGITRVLEYQVADHLKSGALVKILNAFEPPPMPINLLYTNSGVLPLKTRAFIDFAMPRIKKRL